MKKLLTILFILLTTSAHAALTVNNVPRVKTGGGSPSLQDSAISDDGTTFAADRQAITFGDGAAGDVTLTFDGDAGNDGTLTWDVSEDIFQFNYSLYIDSNDVISFDGATPDANRGNLTSADVQAIRTWTLPDATGTIGVFTPGATNDHCVKWVVSGGVTTFGTTGAVCAASGGDVTGTGTSVLNAVPVYSDTSGKAVTVATAGKETVINPTTGAMTVNGDLTVTGTLTSTSAGQAILDEGLKVNNDNVGTDADNDFLVYGAAQTIINLDASSNTLIFDGTWDGGGADSFEVPNGAAPTVDAAGEIAVDTTDDQIKYYGASERVIPYSKEICVTLEDPVDADDNIMFYQPRDAITITDVVCRVDGGTSIPLTISDGTNTLEAITCATTATEDDGSITNGTFTSLERMEFDLGTPTGTQTLLNFCVTYTVDAQ